MSVSCTTLFLHWLYPGGLPAMETLPLTGLINTMHLRRGQLWCKTSPTWEKKYSWNHNFELFISLCWSCLPVVQSLWRNLSLHLQLLEMLDRKAAPGSVVTPQVCGYLSVLCCCFLGFGIKYLLGSFTVVFIQLTKGLSSQYQQEALVAELAAERRVAELLRSEVESYQRDLADYHMKLRTSLESNERVARYADSTPGYV